MAGKKAPAKKKPAAKKAAAPKLHYDKDALLKDYNEVFVFMMKGMGIFVAIILVYFLVYIVYLGDTGHTPPGPFVEQFGDRIDIEYEGKKIPMYQANE